MDGKSNFITKAFCNKLHFHAKPTSSIARQIVVNIKSKHTRYETDITCLIMQDITEPLPVKSFEASFKIPGNLE